MKHLPTLLLALFSVGHTDHAGVNVPAAARLVAKYQVLDEILSPQVAKCAGGIKDFLKAGPYACSFTVQGLEFDIEYKYVVDAKGHLKEFWPYLPEGPDVFTISELKSDPARYAEAKNFRLSFPADRHAVLDGSRRITIERIYPAEKLLLARRDKYTPKGRRFIYQYQ